MAQSIGETDVADILQIPLDAVRKLFVDGDLTGAESEGEWRTTETLLEGDLVVLTENARVARLRSGNYVSSRLDDTADNDSSFISSDTLDEVIGRLRAHAE